MSANSLITVDNVALPQPYQYQYSRQRVSAGESGRTDDAVMHVNQVAQKVKLQLAWRTKNTAEAAMILNAFDPEYVDIRYFDVKENAYRTKKFYTGDRTAPVKLWWVGRHLIETITLDVIEV